MHAWLITTIDVGCLVLVVLGVVAMITSRDVGVGHLGAAAVVELAVLAQMTSAVVQLINGARVDGVVLFVAYLIFALVVLPVGTLWAVGEKTRWSGGVLAVAALALVVTLLRMDAVWLGGPSA